MSPAEGAADRRTRGAVEPPLGLAEPVPALRDDGIVRSAWAGAAVHAVAALAAVLSPTFRSTHVVVSLLLFVGGAAAMAVGFTRAVARSRTEVVDLATTFLLVSARPKATTRTLLACLVVQAGVGVAAAAAHPYTSLAFSILAPLWAWGALVRWSARHARCRPRPGAWAQAVASARGAAPGPEVTCTRTGPTAAR